MFPEDFIDSKEVLGNVVRYFASFGEAIRDFTVEEFCQEDERDAGKSYKINLYFAYHYDKKVREAGNEITEFKVDERYAELIYKLQNKMIQKLVREGIGIETNPSSNYLIGTIQKYDEHPILRFNSRKLRDMERNTSLNVSINTDDQGVFDTMLENEYALGTTSIA